jgi:predicted  nucleic acid-binding Zn-ribbon protein
LALSLVEVSPIKINPWSVLIKWIAKLLGISDLKTEIVQVRDRMDELEKKIDNMKISEEEKDQLKEALAARRRILRFNDELLLKIKHSKEMFNDILKDITDYDNYCRTHPEFKNRKAVFAEENVARAYQQCMIDNSFL